MANRAAQIKEAAQLKALVKAGKLKLIHVPAHMPCDTDKAVLYLEEVGGLLDMLSDQLKGETEQSVTLTALRLVREAKDALVGPTRAWS